MNNVTAIFELASVGGFTVNRIAESLSFYVGDDVVIRARLRDLDGRVAPLTGQTITMTIGAVTVAGTVTSSTLGIAEFTFAKDTLTAGEGVTAKLTITKTAGSLVSNLVFEELITITAA